MMLGPKLLQETIFPDQATPSGDDHAGYLHRFMERCDAADRLV